MRKYIKQKICNTLDSIFSAEEVLKCTITNRDADKMMNLLQDMQAAAIEIGETIERTEGTGTETVQLLEDSCELFWEVSQADISERERLCIDIHGKLELIRKQISELPEKIEAVFLPYKSSMWDSLESVWLAADADPDCDAYVVPIPYYDRNPDRSFRELHYEGEQFPDYVPVTHYDRYDFLERHPDMVFYHNPYDEHNIVTSVHPFFYTKNLKQYTDVLVYIPYFVLQDFAPGNIAFAGKIAQFAQCTGVINADAVVVQSENMRQYYIDSLVAVAGEGTRKIWENKILGLGSPKFDKVVSTTKDNVEIPNDWKRIMTKPDGEYKKVILYNIGVSALLEHSDRMIEKIRSVLCIFEENKDEIALLWRPHPLIRATIESMRPQLWLEYEQIVEEYKSAGWGIYDDSAELERTIALSDAYYGDLSSLVQLCQKVGMPVMLQRLETMESISSETDKAELRAYIKRLDVKRRKDKVSDENENNGKNIWNQLKSINISLRC